MDGLIVFAFLFSIFLVFFGYTFLIHAYIKGLSFKKGWIVLVSGCGLLFGIPFFSGANWNAANVKVLVGGLIVMGIITTFLGAFIGLLTHLEDKTIRKKCLGLFLISMMFLVIGDSVCSWF